MIYLLVCVRPQNIPLPMDWQNSLSTCQDSAFVDTSSLITDDEIPVLKNYYLNPRDPADGGNHNHKAFSVLAFEDRVWVGTANGINKGTLQLKRLRRSLLTNMKF